MRDESPELPDLSDENLLGYLLGGLSDEESARVEEALSRSEALRQRLSDLRGMLEPMAAMDETFEPRADLVSDTLSLVAQFDTGNTGTRAPLGRGNAWTESDSLAWSDAPQTTRIAWLDSLVAIAAGIIFLSILLPGIWQWREAARQFACAENLRNVGFGLLSFVNMSPSRELPAIELQGPRTFAGMYAIHLRDRDLLESARWVQCPSNLPLSIITFVPTSQQFLAASPEQQRVFRQVAGGNYAYHLGIWNDGKYQTPSIDAPVRFAVLGDRWPSLDGVVDGELSPRLLHGDRAANMFYNDGSIRLIRIPSTTDSDDSCAASVDNPYLNRELQQAVGIGIQDACLGPSHWLPTVEIDRAR